MRDAGYDPPDVRVIEPVFGDLDIRRLAVTSGKPFAATT